MSHWKYYGTRTWVLGAAATGLLMPSMSVYSQTKGFLPMPRTTPRRSVPAQPAQPAPAPQLLPAPSETEASPIIPISGEKSEVQKQVEALYQQNGREMPEINLQPMTPLGTQGQQAQPQQQTQQQTQPQSTSGNATNSGTRPAQQYPANTNQGAARPGYTSYQPRTGATPYTLQPAKSGSPANVPPQMGAQYPVQSQAQYQPQQYQPQYQSRQNPIAGFFRRISGTNKPLPTQPPIPPDAGHSVPGTPSFAAPSNGAPAALPLASTATPATPLAQSGQPAMLPMLSSTPSSPAAKANQTNVQITTVSNGAAVELTPPLVATLPILSAEPLPPMTGAERTLPPLMTEAQPNQFVVKSEPSAEFVAPKTAESVADFPNPFTEVTETEADEKIAKSPGTSDKGLETPDLNDQSGKPQAETEPEAVAMPDENPFDVPAKDFSEPLIVDTKEPSVKTTPAPSIDAGLPPVSAIMPDIGATHPSVAPLKPEVKPNEDPKEVAVQPPRETETVVPPDATPDPSVEKMRRIRERFGMKGLKGFCPVTLHDERELVDAVPDFHVTYRSQKFHFATEEARDKFQAEPGKYAPAAYGADVVALSRDKDVVEGTLDFAAWFKGRLYLFGTQANYDTFIASPAKFATLVEGE